MPRVRLGYGREPLEIEVPDGARVIAPHPPAPPPRLAEALADPIGAPRLRGRIAPGTSVCIIVSDATRDEPRAAMIDAVLEELQVPVDLTIAIANGTHGPADPLPQDLRLFPRHHPGRGGIYHTGLTSEPTPRIWNHDGGRSDLTVDFGTTSRGGRVRLPRFLLDIDLVVATGHIKPHYFAGYGAGSKALFPGLGLREDIRANHRLKADPTARLGRVEGNICRDDLEEAARLFPGEVFLVNTVAGTDRCVAGDPIVAHRAGVALARPSCEINAPPADLVITSDSLPITGSLYQASKLLAPAGWLLRPGGTVVLCAECPYGTGPLDVVNRGIYQIGIRHFFPTEHTIYLVSGLQRTVVEQTYCRFAESVDSILAGHQGSVLVLPAAGDLVPQAPA